MTGWRGGNRTATDEIAEWIASDGDHYERAMELAGGDLGELERFLRHVINTASRHSAPGHVRYALSDRELDSVDWSEVAHLLTCE